MKAKIKKTGHVTKKIIHIKLMIAILLVLPFVVFTFVTSRTDLLFGIKSMTVLSGSMEPSIPVGSVVYIQKSSSYQPGDVISFSNEAGMTVTHRINEIISTREGTFYQTKGDANDSADGEFVASSSILGKSMFSVPYVGYLISWLRTPIGFIAAIIFPALLFIGMELWSVKREIEKNVEKRVLERLGANG